MIKTYIAREDYTDRVKPFLDKNIIKVIVGQMRVGKSYLLVQIMDSVKNRGGPQKNIVYINKELHEFDDIKNYKDLLSYVKKHSDKRKKTTYLFVDEIQDIDQFEKALRSLQAQGGCDIFITGSNADLLSGELAGYLSGRYVEIKVFGLSYPEFLKFHGLADGKEAFLRYLKHGGLPYLIHLEPDDDIVYDYLRNIRNSILYKDVVQRHGIRNVAFLERLTEYLADNIGSLVSAKRISDFLKSQKINISANVVLDYLSFLTGAFFVFKAPRSDVHGRKIFEISEKYYFEDLGLRHSIAGFRPTDIGKILENLVFLKFKEAGYAVTVGKLNGGEIDFVCEKGGQRIYAQVAYLLPDDKTREREFGNLLKIKDNFPKMVISMDELGGAAHKGIPHVNIREFLMSKLLPPHPSSQAQPN
ncbi:MAG: ATP-binding protein [Elusimicrobia bacterium]|nr:ATP-binding protein [Elusimicrobiota bacterium]